MKTIRVMLLLLLAMALFITGCNGTDAPATDAGDTEAAGEVTEATDDAGDDTGAGAEEIIVGQGADPVSLDPQGQNDQSSSRVRVQIFDTLLTQDKDMEFQPALAESWEQIDELTWEFKLREGVTFHNGETFTADDVIFSMQRAIESPNTGHIVGMIDADGFEKIDDNTLRIKTSEPFGPFLAHLAHPASSISNQKAVEEAGDDVDIKPVGTGPYKFVSWDRGDRVTLERFDDYWGDAAKTPRIIFRNIAENANRTIELETGGIHLAYDILPNDVSKVEGNADLQLFRAPNFSTTYVGFNCEKEPFDNPLVRQAINHAVNMDEIVEAVYFGTGGKAAGPLGANVPYSNQSLEPYDYNPEKAKELLAEAGYPDGFETSIWTNDNKTRMDIVEIMQNQLGEVGITATPEVLEWGAYLSQTAEGEHDMFILGWVTVTGDPDYGLYPLFHSSQFGDAGNRTFYANDKVDELLDTGRTSTDDAEREAAYMEVQEIIREDAPWIFTWTGEDLTGGSAKISGFELHPAGHYRLKDVTLSE